MQRQLILMRHAKSSWKDSALADHKRPLNKRGRRDAPRVAERLIALGWSLDAVVSSDSERTRETWARMAQQFPEITPRFEAGLYHGGLRELRESAEGWDASWRCVLVLGHNPGWEEALQVLGGAQEALTTGNAALLRGEGALWRDALRGHWTLQRIIRPRELAKERG